MNQAVGVVMDPIGSINIKKDSTFAMMLAAQRRGWAVWYMEVGDLFYRDGAAMARRRRIELRDDSNDWFQVLDETTGPLAALPVLLMRKDPPFDMEYIYTTYLLELAQREGSLVINDPRALRDANEKVFTTHFPHCAPPTLITRRASDLDAFLDEQLDIIVKPLAGMGGASIFRVRPDDPNRNVIGETLTRHGTRFCLAQRYLPAIRDGDKRVLLVDGEPVPYALARIPRPGETRGNLAAGGRAEGRPLTERDRWIAAQVGPELRRRGILFAGLDIIGDHLTEINITSPTCIRELDALFGLDIAGDLFAAIEGYRR
ncbi:glutathione synthase [Thioalkalicoccus limnaeus]|uniref:Glutathione synthetase n=1 Tax=Thioalkalicoccus limnaeus TaxID=120681 RepID=A0ABV4BDM8_9GAMM